MDVLIEYLEDTVEGRLTASDDVPTYVWNRVRELAISAQPDARITDKTIIADWATVLSIAPDIAALRKEHGFSTNYNEGAEAHLRRYREEVRAVRAASGTFQLVIPEAEIPDRLKTLYFSERELTPEQLRDTARVVSLTNGANFSVPGAGKTTVALAVHLLTRDEETYFLVVAPKNAFAAWDEVITDCIEPNAAENLRFTRLTGGFGSIRDILRNPPKQLIISYDQLTRVREPMARFISTHKVHVILDESHRMKAGERSLRGNTLLRLAHLPVRRDILSGTPIPRSIEDIAAQLDFLWPGQTFGLRAVAAARPHDVLQGLYVRTMKSELRLPPIRREFIQVQMSPAQMALYGVIRQEVVKRLSGIRADTNVDLISAKRSVMRLLQVSSNPIMVVRRLTNEEPDSYSYDDPKIEAIFLAIVDEIDSQKIQKACELARELAARGERSVIWTSFTENVERIAYLLRDLGATYIHGGVDIGSEEDPDTREGRIRLFHDDKSGCQVLVANPAAGGEGINLQKACHHAIYVDRTFNAAHYLQSVDRIHRLGADVEVHIHILESIAPNVTGAIDYSVRRRLIAKLRTMANALDDYDLQRLALDEEEEGAPLDYDITLEDMADVIDELLGKVPAPGMGEDF
ncbi:MAG: DEAD/DEAH box helicase [Proteobacteria bacterium]|nr:DEAD/DEAH box helicase [Pseudomonadota bacterium]